jgi:hypothetical protein
MGVPPILPAEAPPPIVAAPVRIATPARDPRRYGRPVRRLAAGSEPTGETEMSLTIDRDGTRMRAEDNTSRRHGGPVVLATFDGAPLQAAAVRLAVESAADMRSSLLVVDAVAARPGRRGAGPAVRPSGPRLSADLAALRDLATDLGVEMQAVRLASLRPRQALVEAVSDRRAALVVLATDPTALRRFRMPTRREHRRFVEALAADAPCLLWTAQEPGEAAASKASRSAARARRRGERRALAVRSMTTPPRSAGVRLATNGNPA